MAKKTLEWVVNAEKAAGVLVRYRKVQRFVTGPIGTAVAHRNFDEPHRDRPGERLGDAR